MVTSETIVEIDKEIEQTKVNLTKLLKERARLLDLDKQQLYASLPKSKKCRYCEKEFVMVNHRWHVWVKKEFCNAVCFRAYHRLLKANEFGNKCKFCGENKVLNYHHIVPLSEGGADDASNLISLCPNHHSMLHKGLISITKER